MTAQMSQCDLFMDSGFRAIYTKKHRWHNCNSSDRKCAHWWAMSLSCQPRTAHSRCVGRKTYFDDWRIKWMWTTCYCCTLCKKIIMKILFSGSNKSPSAVPSAMLDESVTWLTCSMPRPVNLCGFWLAVSVPFVHQIALIVIPTISFTIAIVIILVWTPTSTSVGLII